MYPYHNKIKSRIKAGELESYYFAKDYPNIGEELVLVFNTPPFKRPIRPERWHEYVDILADWNEKRKGLI